MIGETFYYFDGNHRVYERDGQGRASGGPIYAEHFRPIVVFGETSRSWLAGWENNPRKIPKKDFKGYYTHETMQDAIWAKSHRYKILDLVKYCSVEDLKEVAVAIGYNSKEQSDG